MTPAAGKYIIAALLAAVTAITAAVMFFRKTDSAELIVLMYHHVAEEGDDVVTVSNEKLSFDISCINASSYTAVSLAELISFADGKGTLPMKAVCIVFDDGYESNYSEAFPILKKYGVKAAIGVIGSAVGTRCGSLSHFTWEQAAEMEASGLVTIFSHTYCMHMASPDSDGGFRPTAARIEGEAENKYRAAFLADHRQMASLMRSKLGHTPIAFAYPHGISDPAAEEILTNEGVRITFTTDAGVNIIKRGKPETLRMMKRYNVNESVNVAELLSGASNQNDVEL